MNIKEDNLLSMIDLLGKSIKFLVVNNELEFIFFRIGGAYRTLMVANYNQCSVDSYNPEENTFYATKGERGRIKLIRRVNIIRIDKKRPEVGLQCN